METRSTRAAIVFDRERSERRPLTPQPFEIEYMHLVSEQTHPDNIEIVWGEYDLVIWRKKEEYGVKQPDHILPDGILRYDIGQLCHCGINSMSCKLSVRGLGEGDTVILFITPKEVFQ